MNKLKISSYFNNNELEIERVIKDYTNYVDTIIRSNGSYIREEDKEEIIADVFFTVWKKQEKMALDKDLSPYIFGITKNLILKKYREIKNNSNTDDYEEMAIISEEDVEINIIIQEKLEIVEKELNKLSESDRFVFDLYYFKKNSLAEISSRTKYSKPKIKAKLFKIRKKLKKTLIERGYYE